MKTTNKGNIMDLDPRKFHFNVNGQNIHCFNLIDECSSFLITLEDGDDFYADYNPEELDLEKSSNRKWIVVADYFSRKYKNYKIAEIVAC